MRTSRIPTITALALVAGATAACATKRVVERPVGPPANAEVAASLVVDQFLRAANSNDLDTMARLFGNRDGPVANDENRQELDRRLFAIASVLHHDSYSIKGSQIVPGRRNEATQINVLMKFGTQEIEVPWLLVYSKNGNWLVESIDIEKITSRR
jgi:ABC-type transporter MlaC component